MIITIVGIPDDIPLIAGFVKLQRAEALIFKKYKNACKIPLLWSENRIYIFFGYNN